MVFLRKAADHDELLALCALLMIWICAIISPRSDAVPAAVYPKIRSDEVLIIDPGHGGMDGGACALDGTKESILNLSIAFRLRDMGALLGISSVMTRDSEELDYPPEITSVAERKRWDTRRRCEEINEVENGFLISIHQNYYPSPGPQGIQVLYSSDAVSRQWGEQLQALFAALLCTENRRVAIPADHTIYLMNHVHCPAVLVECGFLSHPVESERLKETDYQLCLAAVLAESALEQIGERHL